MGKIWSLGLQKSHSRQGMAWLFRASRFMMALALQATPSFFNKKIWINPDDFSPAVSASEYPQSSLIERAGSPDKNNNRNFKCNKKIH
ncbi:hypothetical protein ACO0K9_10645 [Undibacterium sp. Ji50W]